VTNGMGVVFVFFQYTTTPARGHW